MPRCCFTLVIWMSVYCSLNIPEMLPFVDSHGLCVLVRVLEPQRMAKRYRSAFPLSCESFFTYPWKDDVFTSNAFVHPIHCWRAQPLSWKEDWPTWIYVRVEVCTSREIGFQRHCLVSTQLDGIDGNRTVEDKPPTERSWIVAIPNSSKSSKIFGFCRTEKQNESAEPGFQHSFILNGNVWIILLLFQHRVRADILRGVYRFLVDEGVYSSKCCRCLFFRILS